MEIGSLRQLIRSRRFALVDPILAMLCGAVWMLKPEWGIWFFLIALLPFVLSFLFDRYQFKWSDLLILVFAATAWVGYWAAYDQKTAWNKAWLLMTAILLYFSLRVQPEQNLFWISISLFGIGVGVSLYFLLTHDFVAVPRKLEFVNSLGRWIMNIRPKTGWMPIHPNYVAGTIAITVPFAFYPVGGFKKSNTPMPVLYFLALIVGLGCAGLVLVMATSRGVVLAIVSGVGAWLLWRLINLNWFSRQLKIETAFPILLLAYLCVVVVLLYFGPARSTGLITINSPYGNGSRGELFSRSLFLLFDYPITGGGLGSFPGLYSRYLLDIPFFYLPNSHNLFLDVAIEQGIFGGASFLFLYIASLWMVSRSTAKSNRIFSWIVLFSLIIAIVHGMVDDYLYNGAGSILSLFLIGLSATKANTNDAFMVNKFDNRITFILVIVCALLIMINNNRIRGIWYANLGAVQMAKVELDGFPNTGWVGYEIVPRLNAADASLHSSLQFDPANRTANQRLGLISMSRRDFDSAVKYLETADIYAPTHRGIMKSLAYCYVWLGDMEKAQPLLRQIPEAKDELDVYTRWWAAQGRSDLSGNAVLALKTLTKIAPQP
jgi:O-antigen ligase